MEFLTGNTNWSCGAGITTGSPDPVWNVDEFTAEELISIWDSAISSSGKAVKSNFLGYKGCWLRSSENEEWYTYKGTIIYKWKGKVRGIKTNEDRSFERKILSTIPGKYAMSTAEEAA